MPTVTANRARYTTRELLGADAAARIIGTMRGVPPAQIVRMFNEGNVLDTSVMPADVVRTVAINGPPLAGLKGRSTARTHPMVPHDDLPVVRVRQELHADLFIITGLVFRVNVMMPMRYLFVKQIRSKVVRHGWKVLQAQLRAA